MAIGFGTDNLVFVPPGGRLRIWDVYTMRRIVVDVHRAYPRMRPELIPALDGELAQALADLERDRATRDRAEEFRQAAQRALLGLSVASGPTAKRLLVTEGNGTNSAWWMRASDRPAESFFAEDYAEGGEYDGPAVALPLYGNLSLTDLEGLDVPLPGRGQESPFQLILPEKEGITIEPINPAEPLPLVNEYCGVQGVAARGETVNISLAGEVAPEHLGAVPVRMMGDNMYATLYFHVQLDVSARVAARLTPKRHAAVLEALVESGFEKVDSGATWSIHERRGYHVHVYHDLEGKETAGVPRLPPFVFVASAAGEPTPAARADLLQQILDVSAA